MVSWCYWGRGELEPPRTVMPLLPLVPPLLLPPSPSSVKYFRLNPLQPRFLVCMRRRTESFDVAALSQRKLGSFRFFCNFLNEAQKGKNWRRKKVFLGETRWKRAHVAAVKGSGLGLASAWFMQISELVALGDILLLWIEAVWVFIKKIGKRKENRMKKKKIKSNKNMIMHWLVTGPCPELMQISERSAHNAQGDIRQKKPQWRDCRCPRYL